jgi:hypothetical protein
LLLVVDALDGERSASNLDFGLGEARMLTRSRWELGSVWGALKPALSWASWDMAVRRSTRVDSQVFSGPSVRKRFHLGV